MSGYFTAEQVAALIAVPQPGDDKYSRGVLGIMTGSTRYPGAAVLSVEGALRTGVGMVRYSGPERAVDLVLARRPEVVPGSGQVQAWLLGSGVDQDSRDQATTDRLVAALASSLPVVVDAGALDLVEHATGPVVITPHHGELARMLGADRNEIAAAPAEWAARAAQRLGVTVLLKGHVTHIASGRTRLAARNAPPWVATAGAGDVLGGVLGALVATNSGRLEAEPELLPRLAAAAAVLHGMAGERASAGGPVTMLDLAAALPPTIADLLSAT